MHFMAENQSPSHEQQNTIIFLFDASLWKQKQVLHNIFEMQFWTNTYSNHGSLIPVVFIHTSLMVTSFDKITIQFYKLALCTILIENR